MLVADLIKSKGGDVYSVTANEPVTTAIALLCAKRIGAALVLDEDGGVAGILSERDLVRAMNRFGREMFDKKVGDLMTAPVVTCAPGDPVPAIMGMMTAQRFRHVPVVDDGRLLGMISIGDVVKSRIEEAQSEVDALRLYISL
jgi:CBS domain-containing protein